MTDIGDAIGTGVGLGVGLAVTGNILNRFDKFGRIRTRKNKRRRKKR